MSGEGLNEPAEDLVKGLLGEETPETTEAQVETPQEPVNSSDEGQNAPKEQQEAVTFQKLLETAGSPEALYAIELPVGEGKDPITIGQAKDLATDAAGLEARKVAQEAAIQDRENEVLTRLRDVTALYDALPDESKSQEVQSKIRAVSQARLEREHVLLSQALPDWADKAVATKEQAQIGNLMRAYGFSDAEIATLSDHRLVKMHRDYSVIRAMLEEAKSSRKPAKKRNPPSQQESGKAKGNAPGATDAGLTLLTGLKKG